MVHFKPRQTASSALKENCRKTGGEYKQRLGGRTHVCEYQPDEERGYHKRRVVLDTEEGSITAGSGGLGMDLDDVKYIKTDRADPQDHRMSEEITGKPATDTLKIEGTRGEITVQGSGKPHK